MPTYLPPNAGLQLSAAIAEAYASATVGAPVLLTLELRHPDFRDEDGNATSAWIVNDYRNLVATDETSSVRTFIGVPFRYTKPDQTDSGAPKAAQIELDNVSLEVTRLLLLARASEPVAAIEREYLPSDTSAPHVLPVTEYELASPVITVETITAQLTFGNLTNRKYPAQVYTFEEFPVAGVVNLTPHASAAHWAAGYVGRAWAQHFNCWHLVQVVQREAYGRELPDLPVGTDKDQTAALLAATQGWRRVQGSAQDGDVITMIGDQGPHVGVVVGAHQVLHNVGGDDERGVWGSVRLVAIDDLGSLGFGHLKLWRAG